MTFLAQSRPRMSLTALSIMPSDSFRVFSMHWSSTSWGGGTCEHSVLLSISGRKLRYQRVPIFFKAEFQVQKKKNRQIFTEIRRWILQAKIFSRALHPLLYVHTYVLAGRG